MALMIAIIILLSSCSSNTDQSTKATIKIGVDFPLSGGLAVYGIPLLEGLQLGVEEINEQGGVNGIPIKLVVENNEGNPTSAATAAQKLIDSDKVDLVVSTMVGPTGAIAPITDQNKKILLYAAAADSFAEKYKYVFKDSIDAYVDCKLMAEYGVKNGWKTVAILGADAEFTLKCQDAIKTTQLQIVAYEKYVKGDVDYRTQLTKIKSLNADVIVLSAYADDCIFIWQQIREIHPGGILFLPFTQTGCGEQRQHKRSKMFQMKLSVGNSL